MDPLVRVTEAHKKGLLPDKIYQTIRERFPIAVAGINRIEKASGLRYPAAYVEPSAVVSAQNPSSFQYGILFARTIPLVASGRLQVVIQITAPLLAYGLRGTIHAILAHEFLHYLELINRVGKMSIVSDEVSENLFEAVYADNTKLFEPRAVFADRTLLDHITKRFPSGFHDRRLEDKVVKNWIEKGLSTINVALDSNMVKISAEAMAKIDLDPEFSKKLAELEQKSAKTRKKKYY